MPYSNYSGLNLLAPPTASPVSVADAKAHSRIFIDIDDSLVAGYLWTAMIACEDRTQRAFMPQSWELSLEQWPGRTPALGYRQSSDPKEYYKWNHFPVPKPPLVSVTYFNYYDTNFNLYTMTQTGPPPLPPPTPLVGNYWLDVRPEPGEIRLPFAGIWPTAILIPGSAIQLGYTCGYAAFSGTMTVDQYGNCTPIGSPLNNFDPRMVGTWITLTDTSSGGTIVGSYSVASYTSPTSIQLQVQAPSPIQFPTTNAGVTYTANAVWMPIRQAILFLAAHLYENREPIVVGRSVTAVEIPGTIDAMLEPYKVFGV